MKKLICATGLILLTTTSIFAVDTCNSCHFDHENCVALTENSVNLDGGNYCLTDDLQLTTNLTINADAAVTLCLNGYTLTGSPDGGSVITVDKGATLNLYGGENLRAQYWNSADHVIITDGSNGSDDVTLEGGIITGGHDSAIKVDEGVLNLFSGNIVGNSSTSDEGGGAIHLYDSKFLFKDGAIVGNTATNGGAIYAYYSRLSLNGGLIQGNTATTNGGGVFLTDGSVCTLSDVNILNNTAQGVGGGLFQNSDTVQFKNAPRITGNTDAEGTSNCYLPYNQFYAQIGALTGDTGTIGITCEMPDDGTSVIVTENYDDNADPTPFFYDDGSFDLVLFATGDFITLNTPAQNFSVSDQEGFKVALKNAMPGDSIILGDNIDLDSTWTAASLIGVNLDGTGYSITVPSEKFLFDTVTTSTISNLTIEGTNIAGFIDKAIPATTDDRFNHDITLRNVQNRASVIRSTGLAGGLIAQLQEGDRVQIENCFNLGAITGRTAGGLIGEVVGEVFVQNSYNAGSVSAASNTQGGGLVGCVTNEGTLTLYACHNRANITGTNAGGLVGQGLGEVWLSYCYNFGHVASTTAYAGGLVGIQTEGLLMVTACYNTGYIKAVTAGGLLGQVSVTLASSVKDCYNAGYVEGTTAAYGITNSNEYVSGINFNLVQDGLTDGMGTLVTRDALLSQSNLMQTENTWYQANGSLYPTLQSDTFTDMHAISTTALWVEKGRVKTSAEDMDWNCNVDTTLFTLQDANTTRLVKVDIADEDYYYVTNQDDEPEPEGDWSSEAYFWDATLNKNMYRGKKAFSFLNDILSVRHIYDANTGLYGTSTLRVSLDGGDTYHDAGSFLLYLTTAEFNFVPGTQYTLGAPEDTTTQYTLKSETSGIQYPSGITFCVPTAGIQQFTPVAN